MIRFLARWFLRVTGWKVIGEVPPRGNHVMIAAPHTSNWDLPYLLAFAAVLRARVSWMGKEQIFTWPFGGLMRRLGGVPVRRDAAHNMVEQMVKMFVDAEDRILVVPPEGTRGRADYWKSGFYYIAYGADIPVVPSFLDWGTRQGGVGEPIELSGDVGYDMDRFRAFYAGMRGKRPSGQGPIRLKAEDGD